jgi:hypothetical protein
VPTVSSIRVVGAVVCATFAVPRSAHADALPEAEYPAEEARRASDRAAVRADPEFIEPAPIDPKARLHDGFFLRLGIGFGQAALNRTVARSRSSETALSNAVELLVGGTPWTGVVVGGGDFILDRTGNTVGGFFGFVQYYPDPRGGLHAFGNAGVLIVDRMAGPFGSIGGGYDAWVGSQWSLGVDARLGAGTGSGTSEYEDDTGSSTESAGTFFAQFATVAFTVTYH